MWKRDKSPAARIMGLGTTGAAESNSESPRDSEEPASSSRTAQRGGPYTPPRSVLSTQPRPKTYCAQTLMLPLRWGRLTALGVGKTGRRLLSDWPMDGPDAMTAGVLLHNSPQRPSSCEHSVSDQGERLPCRVHRSHPRAAELTP